MYWFLEALIRKEIRSQGLGTCVHTLVFLLLVLLSYKILWLKMLGFKFLICTCKWNLAVHEPHLCAFRLSYFGTVIMFQLLSVYFKFQNHLSVLCNMTSCTNTFRKLTKEGKSYPTLDCFTGLQHSISSSSESALDCFSSNSGTVRLGFGFGVGVIRRGPGLEGMLERRSAWR